MSHAVASFAQQGAKSVVDRLLSESSIEEIRTVAAREVCSASSTSRSAAQDIASAIAEHLHKEDIERCTAALELMLQVIRQRSAAILVSTAAKRVALLGPWILIETNNYTLQHVWSQLMLAISAWPPALQSIREVCGPILNAAELHVPGRHSRLYASLATSFDTRDAAAALDRLETKLRAAALHTDQYSLAALQSLWAVSGRASVQASLLCPELVKENQELEVTAHLLASAVSAWRSSPVKDIALDAAAIVDTVAILVKDADLEDGAGLSGIATAKLKVLGEAASIVITALLEALKPSVAARWARSFFRSATIALRISSSINTCTAISACVRILGPTDQPLLLRRIVATLASLLLELCAPIEDAALRDEEDQATSMTSTAPKKRRRRRYKETSSSKLCLTDADILLVAESALFVAASNALRDTILNCGADLPENSRHTTDTLAAQFFLTASSIHPESAAFAALEFATSTLIAPDTNAQRSDLISHAKEAAKHDAPDRPQLDAALSNLRCIIDSLLRPRVPNRNWRPSTNYDSHQHLGPHLLAHDSVSQQQEPEAPSPSVENTFPLTPMDTYEDVTPPAELGQDTEVQREEAPEADDQHGKVPPADVEIEIPLTVPENTNEKSIEDDDDSFPDIVVS